MKRVKIAQIGINEYSHARDIFNTLKAMPNEFEIVGYVLVEDEREKFSHILSLFDGYKELTLEQVLKDDTIEAVTIETEEKHLTRYAKLCAKHGKHIHMEKPGGQDLTEFEELVEEVKKSAKTFHLGYMYRYNPAVKEMLTKVKSGELGEIICVEANMDCHHTLETRKWLKDYKGGMTFFLGCHLIDLIMQIQGEPKNVIPLNKSTSLKDGVGEDFGLALLEYENGYSIAKACAVEYGGYTRRQLVVTGTFATIELKPLEDLSNGVYYTGIREVYKTDDWYAKGESRLSESYLRYQNMMRAFCEMVRGNIVNPYTYDYEKALYKTIIRCIGGK